MSWEPTTYDELGVAESDGRLVESASLELKSTINNAKLARSLASLAINGGTLLIGVNDDGSSAPIELDGWTEKIAQVGWARVTPGLSPRAWTLPNPANPSHGVVVVAVDASPQAPHMADDRYPARLGTTTGYLSDPDVERLMERRQLATRDASAELAGYRDRDPDPDGPTAHAFIVAVPRLAEPDLLNTAQQSWLMNELIIPVAGDARITSAWAPSVGSEISTYARRIDGAAFTCGLSADRTPDTADRARAAELEINDNGILRLYSARASDVAVSQDWNLLLPAVCVGLTMQVLLVAARVKAVTGYLGPWACGVAFTNLEDKPAHWPRAGSRVEATFPGGEYTKLTTATAGELEQPERIGWRLLGGFLRALGANQRPELVSLGLQPITTAD